MKGARELKRYLDRYKRVLKARRYDDLWLWKLQRAVGFRRPNKKGGWVELTKYLEG
jgi:hypothetical protein